MEEPSICMAKSRNPSAVVWLYEHYVFDTRDDISIRRSAREGSLTQVLQFTMIAWELMAVNDPKEQEAKNTEGFIKSQTTSLLIRTFVNNNHWMLCVARLPSATNSVGKGEYFNSFHGKTIQGSSGRYLEALNTSSYARS